MPGARDLRKVTVAPLLLLPGLPHWRGLEVLKGKVTQRRPLPVVGALLSGPLLCSPFQRFLEAGREEHRGNHCYTFLLFLLRPHPVLSQTAGQGSGLLTSRSFSCF